MAAAEVELQISSIPVRRHVLWLVVCFLIFRHSLDVSCEEYFGSISGDDEINSFEALTAEDLHRNASGSLSYENELSGDGNVITTDTHDITESPSGFYPEMKRPDSDDLYLTASGDPDLEETRPSMPKDTDYTNHTSVYIPASIHTETFTHQRESSDTVTESLPIHDILESKVTDMLKALGVSSTVGVYEVEGSQINLKAYRLEPSVHIRRESRLVHPYGFPNELSIVATFRMRENTPNMVWNLWEVTDRYDNEQFRLRLYGETNAVELYNVAAVGEEVTTFENVGTAPIRQYGFIGTDGVTVLATGTKRNATLPVDIQQFTIYGNPKKASEVTCCELPGICEKQSSDDTSIGCPCRPTKPGFLGFSGPNGYPGDKGRSGFPGSQGRKGYQGFKGVQGRRGDPGARGEEGEEGSHGDPGYSGAMGIPGPPGEKGVLGAKGKKGAAGYSGPQGEPGPKGEIGDTGESGEEGSAGSPGEVGAPGNSGPPGPPGIKGLKGFPGYPGFSGDIGEPGDLGYPGSIGHVGTPGRKGDIGMAGRPGSGGMPGGHGPLGIPGILGETGQIGPKGDRGDPGPRGPQGPRGFPGMKGDARQSGIPGKPGEKGAKGLPGPQGEPGPDGEKGETGKTGAQGKSGPKGDKGEMGDKGQFGRPGPPGDVGIEGRRGVPGIPGPRGFPGPMGERGEAGQRGEPGSVGAHGPGMPLEQVFELCKRVMNEQLAIYSSAIRRTCARACPANNVTLIGPPGPPGLPGKRGEQAIRVTQVLLRKENQVHVGQWDTVGLQGSQGCLASKEFLGFVKLATVESMLLLFRPNIDF
ncbi:hypothetical protein chiPu_0008157 [Chiloscyllium punctatum]|uniref:Thrombospondin-like N-terminal domain-containing protein n=1 Tax=Chiloscyllium punctatum TaxID=137246 RepID=A0A401SH90_CHIPU|nr:hypothetical protein [Chiloscyllium punctatum]